MGWCWAVFGFGVSAAVRPYSPENVGIDVTRLVPTHILLEIFRLVPPQHRAALRVVRSCPTSYRNDLPVHRRGTGWTSIDSIVNHRECALHGQQAQGDVFVGNKLFTFICLLARITGPINRVCFHCVSALVQTVNGILLGQGSLYLNKQCGACSQCSLGMSAYGLESCSSFLNAV